MPSAQVELDDRQESLDRIIDVVHWQQSFRMGHKAAGFVSAAVAFWVTRAYLVILSSMDLGSNMKVGRVTLLRSAPGLNCDIMCDSTAAAERVSLFPRHSYKALTISLIRLNDCNRCQKRLGISGN